MQMQVQHSLETLQGQHTPPIAWALGFFDGMHLGHQAVIAGAQKMGGQCGLLSFTQHPLQLLCPQQAPLLLSPRPEQKQQLAAQLGVQQLVLLPFTPTLAQQDALAFLDSLRQAAPCLGFSVGHNYHFGRGGQGNVALLQAYTQEHGLQLHIAAMQEYQHTRICSTSIRAALAAGHMQQVAAMLGRFFSIRAEVEHGQKLARQLGFNTANMRTTAQAALPPFGSYLVRCQHQGAELWGVANLGLRPSIEEKRKEIRLESHFFDWQGDLYGQVLEVELRQLIRKEQRFASITALQKAIAADTAVARELMHKD